MLKASHLNQVYALEELVYRKYPEEITRLTERIAGYEQECGAGGGPTPRPRRASAAWRWMAGTTPKKRTPARLID